MTDAQSGPDLLNDLAHEFAERYRMGERPALTEYTDRYPDLAKEQWSQCFSGRDQGEHSRALAAIELRKLGVEPPIVRAGARP